MSDTSNQPARPGFFAAMRAHPASVGESYFGHMRLPRQGAWSSKWRPCWRTAT